MMWCVYYKFIIIIAITCYHRKYWFNYYHLSFHCFFYIPYKLFFLNYLFMEVRTHSLLHFIYSFIYLITYSFIIRYICLSIYLLIYLFIYYFTSIIYLFRWQNASISVKQSSRHPCQNKTHVRTDTQEVIYSFEIVYFIISLSTPLTNSTTKNTWYQ